MAVVARTTVFPSQIPKNGRFNRLQTPHFCFESKNPSHPRKDFHSFQLHFKPPKNMGFPICNIRTSPRQEKNNQLSEDYKVSWKDELEKVVGSRISAENWDDDEFFQSLIDRRGVDNLRMLVIDLIQHAKAGHLGMALGMAEVGYFLYRHVMRYNPKNPKWSNRDRFVLSAGHGCLLQYVCLHLVGFESVQANGVAEFKHHQTLEVHVPFCSRVPSIKEGSTLKLIATLFANMINVAPLLFLISSAYRLLHEVLDGF